MQEKTKLALVCCAVLAGISAYSFPAIKYQTTLLALDLKSCEKELKESAAQDIQESFSFQRLLDGLGCKKAFEAIKFPLDRLGGAEKEAENATSS